MFQKDPQHGASVQRRILLATSISYVIVLLDATIVNVALDRIAGALRTDMAGLQWVMNAYTLAFACLLMAGGTLGDRWGDAVFISPDCCCLRSSRWAVQSPQP